MRLYTFVNMYLSSIQAGIQTEHVVPRLFVKYAKPGSEDSPAVQVQAELLWEWAKNHETAIVLNGGYSQSLRDIIKFLSHRTSTYPFAYFNESQEALDGALTCVGVVLPESIYKASELIRDREFTGRIEELRNMNQLTWWDESDPALEPKEVVWTYNDWEVKLIQKLNGYSLAR